MGVEKLNHVTVAIEGSQVDGVVAISEAVRGVHAWCVHAW